MTVEEVGYITSKVWN